MPRSLALVPLHLVFSTKNRRPLLADRDLRLRKHACLGASCSERGSPPIRVGGVEDHVHVACRFGRTITIADLVRDLKRASSRWLKEEGVAEFDWQDGYGAFGVSPGRLTASAEYIDRQEAHHRNETFQDEFRRLLQKYGVEFDERHLWDQARTPLGLARGGWASWRAPRPRRQAGGENAFGVGIAGVLWANWMAMQPDWSGSSRHSTAVSPRARCARWLSGEELRRPATPRGSRRRSPLYP